MISIMAIKDEIIKILFSPPRILGSAETIDKIIAEKTSVSRFGDGEISLLLKIRDIGFQNSNENLSKKLFDTLKNKDSNLLVCLPKIFNDDDLKIFNTKAYFFWNKYVIKNRFLIYKLIDRNKIYGNSLFTRNYIDIKNKNGIDQYFQFIKRIWDNKDVIIVEGRYTRFGVNNDLLSNASSVKRILCPEKNAFDKYEIIYNCILNQNKKALYLLALGPTATVLAADLSKEGFWAIDIGHLDIEYEWFLMHAAWKTKVNNKYVNETNDIITEKNDDFFDEAYEKQIICKIF